MSKRNERSHRNVGAGLRIVAAIAAGIAGAHQAALAADTNFTGPAGTPADYGTATNWSGGTVPTSADTAFISGGRIATSAYTGSVGTVNVGPNGNTGTGELRITGGSLTAAGFQLGHDSGTVAGVVTVTGGTLTSSGNAVLGEQGTGDNKFVVSGGALNLNGETYLGANGNGSLLVSGTGVASVQRVDVGNSANSTGIISVSGGTLNMTGKSYIGLRGYGQFNISGGTVNGSDLGIGQEGDVPGVRGVMNVTGGTSTFGQAVFGEISPGDNQLNASAGTVSFGEIYDGANGKATVNISGTAVVNVANRIHLGANSGVNGTNGIRANGTLNITGGTLNATDPDTGWILVGDGDDGTYSQTAGSVAVSRFAVGQNSQALGTATQTGGTFRSRLTLVVGEVSPNDNTYTLSGGTAEIGTDGADLDGNGIFIGSASGKGTVTVSGTGTLSSHNPINVGFGKYGTSDGTLNVNTGGTVSTLNAGDQGRLRLGIYGGTTGRLNINGGTVNLAGPLYNGVYDVLGGGGLGGTGVVTLNSGALTAAATENEGTYTQAGGTATLGAVTGAGSMTISAGTATVTSLTQSSIALSGNGQLKIANAATPAASVVNSLTLAGTSKLDITNNGLIIDYTGSSPITAIRQALAAGRIVSTLTPTDARQAVAYGEQSTLGLADFYGASVDGTSLVLRSRLKGDTNFSGTVDFADLLTLAKHYNVTTNMVWTDGDVTYDGAVNFDDLLALAKNYNGSLSAAASVGDAAFKADWGLAQALAPEPASLAAACVAGGLFARRRRRQA